MAYIYRCSRCRTRNTFHHSVGWYKIKRECRDCAYTKFYPDKERIYRPVCRCMGAYFWGVHRVGAAYCEKNQNFEYNRAVRDGADAADLAWAGLCLKTVEVEGDDVPF